MVFQKDPEKQKAKEEAKEQARQAAAAEKVRQQAEAATKAFQESPQGRSHAAFANGQQFFQISLSVSATQKSFWGQTHQVGQSTTTRTTELDAAGILQAIESEGWCLEHVGFVFRPTTTESRDRFLAKGRVETVMGEVQGLYLFRRAEENRQSEPVPPARELPGYTGPEA